MKSQELQLRPPPPFCLNPRLQAELDRFKEIQKNPHVLFQTLREMERRKQREKNFRRDLCHICGAMIRSLCTHLKVHFGHPCHIGNCQDVFKSNLKLIEHRKVVHYINLTRKCLRGLLNESGKFYLKASDLTRWFICKVCGKVYREKLSLLEHFHVHTNEKPKICSWCSKGFRQRCALSAHRKRCKQNPN